MTGDESAEVLILNCNSTFTPEIQILPTNTSVNYRKTVWTSSAENIVSVDANGQLNAKAIGTATVTISLEGYESVNDSIEIQVVEVFANDLQLHLTTSELPVGKTTALKAALSPANATSRGLTYKSSDKEVAEVSSAGIVRAKKEGKVTISVSYLSLTDKNGEKFAITREVTLTVVPNTEPNIPLEKIELSLEDNGSIFYDEGKRSILCICGRKYFAIRDLGSRRRDRPSARMVEFGRFRFTGGRRGRNVYSYAFEKGNGNDPRQRGCKLEYFDGIHA